MSPRGGGESLPSVSLTLSPLRVRVGGWGGNLTSECSREKGAWGTSRESQDWEQHGTVCTGGFV